MYVTDWQLMHYSSVNCKKIYGSIYMYVTDLTSTWFPSFSLFFNTGSSLLCVIHFLVHIILIRNVT